MANQRKTTQKKYECSSNGDTPTITIIIADHITVKLEYYEKRVHANPHYTKRKKKKEKHEIIM